VQIFNVHARSSWLKASIRYWFLFVFIREIRGEEVFE